MRAASFACLVACAHPSPRPATPIDPTDAELGLLAIVPAAARTPDSWLPVLDPGAKIAAFLPEPWAGPVYGESRFPPSPILTDARGISLTGTYGDAGTLRDYGCGLPHGLVPIHVTGALQPGVAWLLPGTTAWKPHPVEIRTISSTPARREHALGPVRVELTRVDEDHGLATFSWAGHKVHELALSRSSLDQLEAAWTIGDGGAILIVLRDRRGPQVTTLRAVILNERTGRDASGMITVLCYALM